MTSDPKQQPDTAARLLREIKRVIHIIALLGMVWAISEAEYVKAILIAIVTLVALSPASISRRYNINLPPEFEIIAVLFLYASLFLGEFGDFYNRYWWWDSVLHTGSGFLLGVVAFILVFTLNQSPRAHLDLSPFFQALFAFSFAVAAGAVWEIFEFTMDSLFGMNMQKSGLVDTMFDLIVDTIGALVVSIMGYAYLKHGRRSFLNDWIERFLRKNPQFLTREERRSRSNSAIPKPRRSSTA